MGEDRRIAYFSMEIGLVAEIPTYAGGLGALAGDTLRAAADLRVPMVAVTLLHRKGYFRQTLDGQGHQSAEPVNWIVEDFLQPTHAHATVTIEGRKVALRAWTYDVTGSGGYTIPVYFVDADLVENGEWDRTLTDYLYGGDGHYRLCQEVILGVGGVRILRALGHNYVERFHINEGHASLLTVELLDEKSRETVKGDVSEGAVAAVRRQCVFTTHTPVPAGHDRFPRELVTTVLDKRTVDTLEKLACLDGALNMTHLALHLSHHVNGVSRRHGEVSQHLFAPHEIDAITNGIHPATWASEPMAALFDEYVPSWRANSFGLREALRIPAHRLWEAHLRAKRRLLEYVSRETNVQMSADIFTLGFARRAALYKRATLLLDDLDRLERLHHEVGPLQIIYAGKAHPNDHGAKDLIQRVFAAKERLKNKIRLTYLENYDIRVCKLLTAGADVWLNNPEPPLEASGTSGMKAALNGVPSLSVLDGWWIEGCLEGVTGWSIGRDDHKLGVVTDRARAAGQLLDKLEYVVLPTYYRARDNFMDIMRHSIAINGSYFSTHRMVQEYVLRAYFT